MNFIDIYENLEVVIKMYISEISKSKISEQKAQRMTILQTLKVGSLIMGHPVHCMVLIMLHLIFCIVGKSSPDAFLLMF